MSSEDSEDLTAVVQIASLNTFCIVLLVPVAWLLTEMPNPRDIGRAGVGICDKHSHNDGDEISSSVRQLCATTKQK